MTSRIKGSSHALRRVRGARKLVAKIGIHLGTWNVGSLTTRLRELTEVARKRQVDILCVQETRWKGAKVREVEGTSSRLFFPGLTNENNGVCILINRKLTDHVIEVHRRGDRLILVRILLGKVFLNVISAYAPHERSTGDAKLEFWKALDGMVSGVPPSEKLFIGGDFNGHVGACGSGYDRIHGGFGLGRKNQAGKDILNFAESFELMIANTFFEKNEKHLVTYKSAQHMTQIDYILARREGREDFSNCKVILDECVST
ncbi:craniofacial development protein 2-like [Papaver somniferum]|uniref:craniofacial development protein 2-like n=1 Tax=Papaver somniferum TaxID=3469 RepID=UPI000E6FC2B4|nr:craniofacial development protein 2-like [Papaver somniferum]